MRPRLLVTAALTALVLTGCGTESSGSASSADTSPSPTATATTSPSLPAASSTPTVPPPADSSLPPGLEDRTEVQAAMKDAAGRAGIVPGEVVVAGYEAVTWSDGSLGCPQKGRVYPQHTVDGERLLLRVDQRTLEYHAALGGEFSYCASPSGGYRPRAD
ncbi:hypothetical protein [Phycicoccus endophyticus]|uniref:hypothetical protein n=1 Tax=Phycicoccus endophyticus TaxID=1690220 RepID=UPI00140C40DA|nr:hypothetical protein [Phycicoccus endophyticus]NHI19690.1 hypothetical protein [Phycicoccus endophyticus]GGL33821.1 hypothetical protein GCM10012283_15380 [Phycicoccus endophyticus]